MSMDITREQLAKQIHQNSYLTGSFTLRSGEKSNYYFDKYRFESNPELLLQLTYHLKKLLPSNIDLLAGLELGGIPIATSLSLLTKIPCVFVRKKAKEYGTQNIAEGQDIFKKKLLIIEDVVTSGGQVSLSVKDLRNKGAIIEDVLCVIHRSRENHNPQFKELNLKLRSLFNLNDFDF